MVGHGVRSEVRSRIARSLPVEVVACWFGWMRLTRVERGEDDRCRFVDPKWHHVGRSMTKSYRALRKDFK